MTGARNSNLLVAALRAPEELVRLAPTEWSVLVRQARSAGLLARLDALVTERDLGSRVPPQPRLHLESARVLARGQQAETRREVRQVVRALAPLGVPVTLLKGAAYEMARLPAAAGRTSTDVDILVPWSRLAEVESALMLSGWATTHHSPYDEHYYREWMHELPPMQHVRRQTILDVHHAILPRTARHRPDPVKLLSCASPLDGLPGLQVLAPADMVLHAMAHLFHNEDMSRGLRDLSDLDALLRHFGQRTSFWPELAARARELDLERPLYYGLTCTNRILKTPVVPSAMSIASRSAPPRPVALMMKGVWARALRAPHPSAHDRLCAAARLTIYLRAHWLRMPAPLLLRHLSVKVWERRAGTIARA